jgi:ubiquitin carboxyl-terminal hydrolase 4/11/15
MVANSFLHDLNPNNPIGAKGYLAATYAELMKSMWFGKDSSVSAWDLKRIISKFAP